MTLTREQRVKAGPRMEVAYYQVWSDGRRVPERAPKEKRSTPAQAKYNHDQAVKKFLLLVLANFIKGDLLLHLTFDDAHLPESWEQVHRLLSNYRLRVKRWRKGHGLPEMKYAYTVEATVRKSGKRAGELHWHIHLFMSRMPRDVAGGSVAGGGAGERRPVQPRPLWLGGGGKILRQGAGGRRKALRLQPQPEKAGAPRPRDGRVTQRQVRKWCLERSTDAAFWERRFPGYRFAGFEKPPELCHNPYNGYWYLTVILYRRE